MGDSCLGDETAVEADDEWVVGESEDVSLSEHLFHLVTQYQVMFQQSFHRKQMSCLLVADQVHAPVRIQTTPPSASTATVCRHLSQLIFVIVKVIVSQVVACRNRKEKRTEMPLETIASLLRRTALN